MAIINNNVQNVKFLRNQTPFESREAARTALENNKGIAEDGTSLLARYTVSGEVKTIVGYVAVVGTTHHLTIIDVEGGSEDVEKLREEIDAKLGEGITSANTVSDQLAQLSGDTASTSADTSVEGAKRYAEDLIGELDGGITAETGYYVKSVTEVDGKISGTTAELPTVTGEVESKKVVMSVSEDKGEITVNKGTIESSDKTVIISDVETSEEVTGIDFKVNIDGVTLEKDENGVISVTSSALTQYVGDEDTIHISAAVEGVKTVSSPLTISATTPSEANVKEQYNLVGASGNTIGATIKIYKDSALLSVALLHADTTANPQVLPTYDKATNTWTDIAETAQTAENQALCYAYEDVSGNTVVAAVPVGSFINEQEFASGITWDNTANKVRGVVDPTSEKDSQDTPVDFLTVGANGFKISGIGDEIDRKLNAIVADLDADESGTTEHITVNVVEEDGVITTVTVEEDNIANADDLEELSGKTITAITSTNSSITASISNEAGNKTADIQTDADKIKMSGFSADSASALSGIAESDSIATAFEKTNAVITENERVTAGALTDLDERLDVIEDEYISGVSVNGNAVTVADKVAPISITAATSAATATSTEAIVVDTDANGNITLGIANIDCGYYDGTQG